MQRPHPQHVGTLPRRRGRERRLALLLRQSGTLDRACESGETFIGRASLLGCNRWIDCPCGTRVLLHSGTATRVPGGWVLVKSRGVLPYMHERVGGTMLTQDLTVTPGSPILIV